MVSVTMKELLEAGVHFGHQTRRWNPKMRDYIFGKRNGIYIIDLQKTIRLFKGALQFIKETAETGKDILIVGTKKQAQDIIKDIAERSEICYVNQRWLGGLLTNFGVVRGSVKKLIELEEMKEDGRWDLLTKKEQSKLEKVYRKLSKNLGGIKTMQELPGALVVIDSTKEEIAIQEALKLNIPIVAIVDTNGDPEYIDYPIPGNDDAVRAIELFTSKISESILEGKKEKLERELEQTAEEAVSAEEEAAPAISEELEPELETGHETVPEGQSSPSVEPESPDVTESEPPTSPEPEIQTEPKEPVEPEAEKQSELKVDSGPEQESGPESDSKLVPEAPTEPSQSEKKTETKSTEKELDSES